MKTEIGAMQPQAKEASNYYKPEEAKDRSYPSVSGAGMALPTL